MYFCTDSISINRQNRIYKKHDVKFIIHNYITLSVDKIKTCSIIWSVWKKIKQTYINKIYAYIYYIFQYLPAQSDKFYIINKHK